MDLFRGTPIADGYKSVALIGVFFFTLILAKWLVYRILGTTYLNVVRLFAVAFVTFVISIFCVEIFFKSYYEAVFHNTYFFRPVGILFALMALVLGFYSLVYHWFPKIFKKALMSN